MPGRRLPNRLHVRGAIGSERCAGGNPQRGERHTVSSGSRGPARYHRMVSHSRSYTHNRRHTLGRGRRTREGKGDSSAARQARSSGPGAVSWTVLQVLRRRHERQYHLLSQLRKIPVLTGCVTVPSFPGRHDLPFRCYVSLESISAAWPASRRVSWVLLRLRMARAKSTTEPITKGISSMTPRVTAPDVAEIR